MNSFPWRGVIPALTTPFLENGQIDLPFLAKHAAWQLNAGCSGIVALGSLGEGGTLTPSERREVLETLVGNPRGNARIIAGVAALSTSEAVRQAKEAEVIGCRGLMVLPPYAYFGSWRETRAHFQAVLNATALPCMLYNNPIAYRTDVTPEQIAELAAASPTLVAVKESSADIRRLAHIRSLLDDRLKLLIGVDDQIVEGIMAGADGWIAGLVNAFPSESVRLWDLANGVANGNTSLKPSLRTLYHWFLPLLRLDVVPEFVQLIKLAQHCVGMGTPHVRRPRLELEHSQTIRIRELVAHAVSTRPAG